MRTTVHARRPPSGAGEVSIGWPEPDLLVAHSHNIEERDVDFAWIGCVSRVDGSFDERDAVNPVSGIGLAGSVTEPSPFSASQELGKPSVAKMVCIICLYRSEH